MTEYLNTEWTGSPVTVQRSDRLNLPGHWTTFVFNHDISDSYGYHTDSNGYIGNGTPRFIHGVLDYQLIGGNLGEECQIRSYEVDASGARVETHKPHEFYLSSRPVPTDPSTGEELYPKSTHQRFPIMSYLNTGHRLAIEITRWDLDGPELTINQAQFTGNFWT